MICWLLFPVARYLSALHAWGSNAINFINDDVSRFLNQIRYWFVLEVCQGVNMSSKEMSPQ